MNMERKLLCHFLFFTLSFLIVPLTSWAQNYEADLTGINVVQPVQSDGNGTISVTLSNDTLKLSGSFSGLSTTYQASHIHMGAAGTNGSVKFTLKASLSDTVSGSYSVTDNTFILTSAQISELQAGNYYVQIHTKSHPDGELRGQILGSPDNAPSASTVTSPPDGTSITLEGAGSTVFSADFTKSTDQDGNKVIYIWQLATDQNFSSLVFNVNLDTMTTFETNLASIDPVLQQAGLPVGMSITLYHRVITSDGSKITTGTGLSVTLTRGVVDYTIRQAREARDGTQVNIKGIVTRTYGAFTRVQDTSGAITIYQTSGTFYDAVQNGSIAMGDSLAITGTTSEMDYLKVIDQGDLSSYTVLSRYNKLPTPLRIDLKKIAENGEEYESELIRVQGLKFATTGTFAASTTYNITDKSDNSGTVILRTPSSFDGTIAGASIPDTSAIFVGVLSQSSTTLDTAGYQLQPVLDTDVYDASYVQIIHNAADPAADSVDIYVNGIRKVHNLRFRDATKFLELPGDRDLLVGVAPGNSISVSDTLKSFTYKLTTGHNYVLIADGVIDTTKFAANPDGLSTAFNIFVRDSARQEAVDQSKFDFFAVHGVTDAPTVDITVSGGPLLVNNLSYSEITTYGSVNPVNYVINITDANDNTAIVKAFNVDASVLAGKSAVVLASGFLNPANNQNGPDLRLLVVFADGSTAEPAINTAIGDEPVSTLPSDFKLLGNYPNPFNPTTTIKYDLPQAADVTLSVYDILGRKVMTMELGKVSAGANRAIQLNAMNLASGMYIYRITVKMAGKVMTQNGRMTFLK
ncbi:MAG TPA: CHRD domain-containing protein [Balneolales bacterium]|nr:CHRD domain-containing protein [Balneolales bacterium]